MLQYWNLEKSIYMPLVLRIKKSKLYDKNLEWNKVQNKKYVDFCFFVFQLVSLTFLGMSGLFNLLVYRCR